MTEVSNVGAIGRTSFQMNPIAWWVKVQMDYPIAEGAGQYTRVLQAICAYKMACDMYTMEQHLHYATK